MSINEGERQSERQSEPQSEPQNSLEMKSERIWCSRHSDAPVRRSVRPHRQWSIHFQYRSPFCSAEDGKNGLDDLPVYSSSQLHIDLRSRSERNSRNLSNREISQNKQRKVFEVRKISSTPNLPSGSRRQLDVLPCVWRLQSLTWWKFSWKVFQNLLTSSNETGANGVSNEFQMNFERIWMKQLVLSSLISGRERVFRSGRLSAVQHNLQSD